MFRQFATLSTRFRVLIITAAIVLPLVGAAQLRDAPVDTYPEFTPVQVQIQTEALGLSAAEVEQLVTVPLEQDLLNGVSWLAQIRSESVPGLSSVDLIFDPGTDLLQARQQVNERLTQAAALPNVGTPPIMLQPQSSASRVMMIGLTGKDQSLIDLSVLARWKIRPRLMGVPGVSNVAIYGQRDRQLQVQVDPDRLRRNNVSLTQIIGTTGNALWVSPLTFVEASTPGTGGFIETGTQRLAIQHVLPITTAKDLAAVSIEGSQKKLRLGDVTDVVEDHQQLIGDAVLGGNQGLMLVIEKFPGADTRAVTRDVEAALNALRPGLAGVKMDNTVYHPATFVETALHNLRGWTLAGLLLMLAVLGLAFWSWRVALIGLLTVPLSLIAAAYVLYLRGATFNLMVLGGFVVALGFIIDETVTSVAAFREHLRPKDGDGGGQDAGPADAFSAAVATMRGPAVYATLILLLAVLPLYVLDGVSGAFTRPLVLSYVLALLASTLVALIVTPALALLLLGRHEAGGGPLARFVHRVFDWTVPRYVARPPLAYLSVAGLVVLGLTALPQLGGARSLLPAPQDRDLLVHWQASPGTSLPEMSRITEAATREVRALPGVRDVGAHVGRALLSDQVGGVASGELWVSLKPSAAYDATVASIRTVLRGYPGLRGDLLTYPQERVRAAQVGSGADLVVRVYGQDLDTLRAKAQDIGRMLGTVQGVTAPKVQTQDQQPTLEVKVNLTAAQKYGIKPGDVRRAAATFFSGLPAGSLYEQQKIFDVVVWSSPAKRSSPADLANLLIDTPEGGHVRLGDVAAVRITPFPAVIRHEATSRSLDVTAQVRGRDLGAVNSEVRSRLARLAMPQEYHAEVLGDAASRHDQDQRTLAFIVGALIGIFFLLEAAFRSWRLAAMILLFLPLACVGGVVAAFLAGPGEIQSAGALLGLLAVLGIVTRQSVVLVRDYRQGSPIVQATRDRAVPMLATAVATVAALLPTAFMGPTPGAEILHPLAVVLAGGMISSVFCTMFLLPALYTRFFAGPSGVEEAGNAPSE